MKLTNKKAQIAVESFIRDTAVSMIYRNDIYTELCFGNEVRCHMLGVPYSLIPSPLHDDDHQIKVNVLCENKVLWSEYIIDDPGYLEFTHVYDPCDKYLSNVK